MSKQPAGSADDRASALARLSLPAVRLAAIGSTNPVKVSAARAVLAQVCPQALLRPVEIDPGVAAQPLSDEEMVAGAVARATGARDALQADIGVGLEGGVHASAWGVLLTGWAAVVDRQGRVGLGSGGRIVLPPVLAQALEDGEELGPAMDRLSGQSHTRRGPGAVGILTGGMIERDESFRVAITYAFARFLHPSWYPD